MTWEEMVGKIRLWRDDERGILRMVDDNFHVDLDPFQEQTLLAFASPDEDKQRIALQACVGPGKTATLAWCAWWFLSTQCDKHEHPKGAATSITQPNLRDNLWAELSKWQARSPFLMREFTVQASQVQHNQFPLTWFLSARTWPRTASPEEQGKTLSGLHSKFPFVLIDESGAIPLTILQAAEQALSRCQFGKVIQAGNPISREGMLYAAAYRLREQWHVIIITGDPAEPDAWVNSPRVLREDGDKPRKWAQQQIDTYGRDNPWIKYSVLGQFPPASINQLFAVEDIEASMRRKITAADVEWAQKRIAADVARFGDDRTVLAPRQGLLAHPPVVMRNARTTDIAARIVIGHQKWSETPGGEPIILIDDTGHWGHGVLDQLIVAGLSAIPVVYHSKALNPRYENRRAEMYFGFHEWVKLGALPFYPELVGELEAITYTFNTQGKLQVVPKDLIKATLGRSPDLADAYAQTFALPEMAAHTTVNEAGQTRAVRRGKVATHSNQEE